MLAAASTRPHSRSRPRNRTGPKTQFPRPRTGVSGHRFYNANLGRFINRDPIEEAGGINLYGFVLNDAINHWDVLGHLIGDGDAPDNSNGDGPGELDDDDGSSGGYDTSPGAGLANPSGTSAPATAAQPPATGTSQDPNCPAGQGCTIVANGDGTFTNTNANGTQVTYTYDANGNYVQLSNSSASSSGNSSSSSSGTGGTSTSGSTAGDDSAAGATAGAAITATGDIFGTEGFSAASSETTAITTAGQGGAVVVGGDVIVGTGGFVVVGGSMVVAGGAALVFTAVDPVMNGRNWSFPSFPVTQMGPIQVQANPGTTGNGGTPAGVNSGPKTPKNPLPVTNPPQNPTIPPGYIAQPIPGGVIYRAPGTTGNSGVIRVMNPTPQYPNGYWRQYNNHNQPIDPSTGKPGNPGQTHTELPSP